MADRSLIEWTDATWNPITGCTPVSAGCANCYAARMAKRFPHLHNASIPPTMAREEDFREVLFHPARLDQPLRWKKPRRIFCCSMGDLFHEDVSHEWIEQVFSITRKANWHTYMFLTKRPVAMKHHYIRWMNNSTCADVPSNIWLGVTAENQEMADDRIPVLLDTHAEKRFVSIEPMLGPVDLTSLVPDGGLNAGWDVLTGRQPCCHECDREVWREKLDWVICGGESGPGARPMHPDWPRSLRDQCQAAGVPFFFKQNGEWASVSEVEGPGVHHHFLDGATVRRVGKKAAGCLLDGREWKEFPEVKG